MQLYENMAEILKPEVTNYQLTELIGEGLSSCVYRALRTDSRGLSSQTVAVKLLKSNQHIGLLLNEFKTLCRIRSPHCVSVLGWENFDQTSALVLEFVEGLSLERLLRHSALSELVLNEITRQIQLGLEHLRQQALCHGDLSPSNILIDPSGVVRLVDFGLANWNEAQNFGTASFLAPERFDHSVPDYYADLYALGLVRLFVNADANCHGLMALKPSERLALELNVNSKAQGELGELVSRILREHVSRPIVTQVLTTTPIHSTEKRPRKRDFLFCAVGLALWLQLVPSFLTSEALPKASPASFEIRTHIWLWASLNNHDLGYAPIHLHKVMAGRYHLKWKTERAHGVVDLVLESGEHKVMTEADFFRKLR